MCLAANAQVPTLGNNTISKKDVGVVNAKAILNNTAQEALNTWIEIYEFPNYQGKMVRFTTTTENLSLPFTAKNISIKRGSNNLVRISLSTGGLNSAKNVVISEDVSNLNDLTTTLQSPPYSVLFLQLPYVEIFERPNYQGKSIKFPYQVSRYYPNPAVKNYNATIVSPLLPFVSKNVSIKLSDPKLIAYLKINDLNPLVVHGNVPNLLLPYERINSILIDHKVHIVVSLRAILSEIHNNDCKKIYGNIDFELFTQSSMGGQSLALLADKANVTNPWLTTDNINPLITDKWSFDNNTIFRINAFTESKAMVQQQNKICTTLYNIKDFYSPVTSGKPFLLLRGDYSPYDFHFIVGGMNIVEKGVYLKLKVNLGSAHKGCDLCTDFTWDATMANSDIRIIKLEKLGTPTPGAGMSSTYFIGNYRSDVRQNGGTIGPAHSTYLQFDDGVFQNFIPQLKQL
jgi:hypothetical protein